MTGWHCVQEEHQNGVVGTAVDAVQAVEGRHHLLCRPAQAAPGRLHLQASQSLELPG